MKHYIPHICVAIGVIIAQIMCLFLEGSHIDNLFGFFWSIVATVCLLTSLYVLMMIPEIFDLISSYVQYLHIKLKRKAND
jgi:uncharacterized membrane protein